MKMSTNYYTDYPITELGDSEGEPAPIRQVHVLAFDGDLYCKVRIHGHHYVKWLKFGYIYSQHGRSGDVPRISIHVLARLPREYEGQESSTSESHSEDQPVHAGELAPASNQGGVLPGASAREDAEAPAFVRNQPGGKTSSSSSRPTL